MGSCCFPEAKSIKKVVPLKTTSSKTVQRSPVARSKATMDQFMTHKERAALLTDADISLHLKILLGVPFSNFSAFSQHIYLTGMGGMTLENLKQYNIKCLINVAQELPSIQPSNGLLSCKFMFADNYAFPIGDHFKVVTELMHKALQKKDGNVVVYCTAGMSRSSTIVLAYAIKYMKKSLKEAFITLQEARSYARPNLAFFKQLMQFEYECHGTRSVQMVQETMSIDEPEKSNSSGTSPPAPKKIPKKPDPFEPVITVPDFYKLQYPLLFKFEVTDALAAANCPLVSQPGATKAVSLTSQASSATVHSKKREMKPSSTKMDVFSKSTHLQDSPYQSNELKPFILEVISYEDLVKELANFEARKKKLSLMRINNK